MQTLVQQLLKTIFCTIIPIVSGNSNKASSHSVRTEYVVQLHMELKIEEHFYQAWKSIPLVKLSETLIFFSYSCKKKKKKKKCS